MAANSATFFHEQLVIESALCVKQSEYGWFVKCSSGLIAAKPSFGVKQSGIRRFSL